MSTKQEKLAHIESGDPDPVIPPELLILWDIDDYNKLPWDGGLMDQPDILMMLLKVCRHARDVVLADVELIRQQAAEVEAGRKAIQNGNT